MTIPDLAARQLRDYLQDTPGTHFVEDHPLLDIGGHTLLSQSGKTALGSGDSIAGYEIGCRGQLVPRSRAMPGSQRPRLLDRESVILRLQ